MTAIRPVERIDILEGPNLEDLVKPWRILNTLELEQMPPGANRVACRFDEVVYFDVDGTELDKSVYGEMLLLYVLGIELLGHKPESAKNGDYVITVAALDGTFQGHYNTRKRKGNLRRV